MNEPILEALSFSLNEQLEVEKVRLEPPQDSNPPWGNKPKPVKNSKHILPSDVILGENLNTPCLMPGCEYISLSPLMKSKSSKDEFLGHLLREHQFVIDEVDNIANLHRYVIHWKENFTNAPLTTYCVGFIMDDLPSPSTSKTASEVSKLTEKKENPTYYMITPALPEDKEIRATLWRKRLSTVLEVNRQEREQTDFSRVCLLCRNVFKGNRQELFEHMKDDHSFYIGKPDNMVFVEEFLELIADKLDKLICLFCERVFKDRTCVRDHMRKKGHKKLNRNNPEYDRYYVVNYLEPGKNWKMLEEEDQEDERIEEDWIETEEEKLPIVCLLCSYQSGNFLEVLKHMDDDHRFNFQACTVNCDFYQKVKIVNFVRRSVFLNTCLVCEKKFLERPALLKHTREHLVTSPDCFPPPKVWDQPEYYFPTYENDQFLVMIDVLDKDGNADEEKCKPVVISSKDEVFVIPEDLPQNMDKNSSVLKDMETP